MVEDVVERAERVLLRLVGVEDLLADVRRKRRGGAEEAEEGRLDLDEGNAVAEDARAHGAHVGCVESEGGIVDEAERFAARRPDLPDGHRTGVSTLDELYRPEEVEPGRRASQLLDQSSVSFPVLAGH